MGSAYIPAPMISCQYRRLTKGHQDRPTMRALTGAWNRFLNVWKFCATPKRDTGVSLHKNRKVTTKLCERKRFEVIRSPFTKKTIEQIWPSSLHKGPIEVHSLNPSNEFLLCTLSPQLVTLYDSI